MMREDEGITMSDQTVSSAPAVDVTSIWGAPSEIAVCEVCDWTFVLSQASLPCKCPHCFRGELSLVQNQLENLPRIHPPELYLPFTASDTQIAQAIQDFSKVSWFPPDDLTTQNLRARLRRVFLPMWLVDGQVSATWKAEAGFDYEVVSHQNRYVDGRGWSEHAVTEKRSRWEPRLGRLQRLYQNILAPAIEEHAQIIRQLGNFDVAKSQAAKPEDFSGAAVRLPNRSTQDAWPEVLPAFQVAATAECQQAAAANHIRSFAWSPQFQNLNWTLLLLPVLMTYYLDDDKTPVAVALHGQTGRLSTRRRASMKRAQRAAIWIGVAAALVFVLSLALAAIGIVAPPVLVAGGIGILLAIATGVCALIPLGVAWSVNRKAE